MKFGSLVGRLLDAVLLICLNSWASSCMGCKKVVLSRLVVVVYCTVYILFLLRSQFLLLLHRDLVKVSIVFCCSYWGRWVIYSHKYKIPPPHKIFSFSGVEKILYL